MNNAPPPAAVSLSASLGADRAVTFSWPASSEATYFEIVEDIDGDAGPSGERVVAQIAAGALSYRMDDALLANLANATYRLRTCNPSACSASAPVVLDTSGLNGSIVYVKSSNRTGAGDFFGTAVSLSGDGRVMAVGALAENQLVSGIDPAFTGVTAQRVGAVYVFDRDVSGWRQSTYVKAGSAIPFAEFGSSVSLSRDGNVMMVGAVRHADMATSGSGAVYFFRRHPGGSWVEEAMFKAPVPQTNGYMGSRVVLSGNGEWAAAAHTNTAGGGEVLVYRYNAGTGWGLVQTLVGGNTEAGDGFGSTLGLSEDGQTIAVGAPFEASSTGGGSGDNSVPGAGAVYVFRQTAPSVWTQSAFLKASPATVQARYGLSLTLSANGQRLAVGGPQEGAVAGSLPYAEVFDFSAGAWVRAGRLNALASGLTTEFGRTGMAMSADGNLVAVGAHEEDGDGVALNGYQGTQGTFDSGAVFLYRRDSNGVWSAPAYVKATNSRPVLKFGSGIALSADGRMLAVGGPSDSSAATGINGDQTDTSATNAGAVYVY